MHTADAFVLQQSPRGSEVGAEDTPEMRNQVRDAVRNGRYQHLPEYVAAFEAAARNQPDDWPRDPDGRVWQVDHVAELWAGGADDVTNYLALPERLHSQKTGILAGFRARYRDRKKVQGEQVDHRER